jgi:hypothetical protein
MGTWEEQWVKNNAFTKPGNSPRPSSFGADPTVHYAAPVAPVVVATKSGGSFTNAVLLLLGGFAVGTLWGEPLINRALGEKHK